MEFDAADLGLFLGAVFMAMTVVVIVYVLLAVQLRAAALSRPKIGDAVRWCFASLFAGLALRPAQAER